MVNNIVYFDGKRLKTDVGVERIPFDFRTFFHQRFMLSKTDVNQVALVADRLLNIGTDEIAEIIDGGHAPDDVVTQTDGIQRLIESGKSSQNRVKCSQKNTSFPANAEIIIPKKAKEQ